MNIFIHNLASRDLEKSGNDTISWSLRATVRCFEISWNIGTTPWRILNLTLQPSLVDDNDDDGDDDSDGVELIMDLDIFSAITVTNMSLLRHYDACN